MLVVDRLEVAYGKVAAVQGATLEVHEGEVVALVGANGAGKSSILKAVAGVVRPAAGSIGLDGRSIFGLAPHRIAGLGVALVPEGRMIFTGLTIAENLDLGGIGRLGGRAAVARRDAVLAHFPMLRGRLGERASGLSGGEQQLLALARGLVGNPRLLLLDEPSLGLSPLATEEIFALLARLKGAGQTILLVEQNVSQSLELADRGYVLEAGRVVASGPAAALRKDPEVARAYLDVGYTDDHHEV
jgi:branched-chain amino acid transport system ATP-binding protein